MRNRSRFGKITVIYGARNPGLLIYKDELEAWGKRDDINLKLTVDKGDATWKGREGFVPTVCKEVAPSSENAVTVIYTKYLVASSLACSSLSPCDSHMGRDKAAMASGLPSFLNSWK